MGIACWLFGALESFPLYFLLMLAALGILLGVGNLVSVWGPIPWAGARAAAGGVRSTAAAADGGVERPGCGALILRMLLLQTVPLLVAPVYLVVFGVRLFAPELWGMPLAVLGLIWVGLIYGAATGLAVVRLGRAEEKILNLMSSRGAA